MAKRTPASARNLAFSEKPKQTKVHFYMSVEDAQAVAKLAAKYGRSQSEVVRALIRDHARSVGIMKPEASK